MGDDASVIIKIKGNSKDFEKKYAQLLKQYKNKEIDMKITATDLGKEEETLARLNRETDKLDKKYGEINQTIKEQQAILDNIKNTPRDVTTQEGRLENIRLENEYNRINRQLEQQKRTRSELLHQIVEQGRLTDAQQDKVDKLNAKYEKQKNDLEAIKTQVQQTYSNEISQSINTAEKGARKTIKSVARWGLAIFGVRSAYLGLRRIMSSVLSQNKGLSDQMSAMGKSFANAFTPIVEKIINLLKTLMAYMNYIWFRLTGKNLFSDKVASDLKSGEKSAKEIRKQLAGFDEAEVLSNNTSSSGGTTDLGLSKIKIPDWLVKIMDWVKKHPKLSKILFGLAAFTLFGLGKLGGALTITALAKILGKSGSAATGTGGSGLLGILSAIAWLAGIATIVVELVVLWNVGKEIWQNYKALKKEEKEHSKDAIQIVKKNDEVRNSYKKLSDEVGLTTEQTGTYVEWLRNTMEANRNLIKSDYLSKEAKKELAKETEDCALAYQELYENGKLSKDQQYEYYKFLAQYMSGTIFDINNKMWGFSDTLNGLNKQFKTEYILEIKETGIKKIKDAFSGLSDMLKGWFGNNAIGALFNKIGGNTAELWNNAKNAANSIVKKIWKADGGIINLPGRGVPIEYYGGEAGREGIVPIDNEQQMQLLGQAIAKYVNINNVVNNYMDARKINSILQASANNEKLANNG